MCKTVPLTKETIDRIFDEATSQGLYIQRLYEAVYQVKWTNVESAGSPWPACGEKTHAYLMNKAIEFDKEYEHDLIIGWAWMNRGFSRDDSVPEWHVKQTPIMMKGEL